MNEDCKRENTSDVLHNDSSLDYKTKLPFKDWYKANYDSNDNINSDSSLTVKFRDLCEHVEKYIKYKSI